MSNSLIARAQVRVAATPARLWKVLTDPALIREYMFGANVSSDWQEGSTIRWKGEWKGKPYEDKGTVVKSIPGKQLVYTHFSPLTGQPDLPENYHTVTIDLEEEGNETLLRLSQDGNANEEARAHSEKNWMMMLGELKKVAEQ
ncbi:MAG: SRPBCC domain-containing protein [Chitinophagaceae bacterium]|nr:MAG: SRPBCC domain-containing protein [Chitinophagaceae bacterium]